MNEPTRLIDETQSELELALLQAGVAHVEDPLRRARVLAAIGVGAAVALGTKSSTAALLTWKKAVAGVAIAASGVGGVAAYQSFTMSAHGPAAGAGGTQAQSAQIATLGANGLEPEVPSRAHHAAPARAPQATLAPSGAEALSDEPSNGEVGEPSSDGAVVKRRAPRSGSVERQSVERQSVERQSVERQGKAPRSERGSEEPTERAPVVASASDLQAEVAYLDRARSALRGGRPASTLEQLAGYRRTFPNGSLGLEAEVLRIEALAASGRKDEASRRASRLLERSPNSVVAARLRRFVRE